ncbi:MAG: cytochrome b/b6 domain-containing protein [Campylobacterota bacterium]
MKSYIWTLPTRVFHWLLALFVLLAFLTEDDDLITYHAIIGYAILILLIFRVVWVVFGPKYSKFKDFALSTKKSKEYLKNILSTKQKYVGHNPLASNVMIALLVVLFLTIISGVLTFGIQEGKGVLSFLNSSSYKEMELFEQLHEILANLVVALIVLHLLGVFVDKVLKPKHKTLDSIFTGYKNTNKNESVSLNIFQKLIALLFFVGLIYFFIFSLIDDKNIFLSSKFEAIDYKQENALFVKECSSCHILYPPHLLPKKSWKTLMSNLDNHFGDDAWIVPEDNRNILNYLLNNSAQNSTRKESYKILNSIGNKDIIAITKTTYWKKEHKKIPKEVFKHKNVKSKANCKACHSDIEKGLIKNENIKDIDTFI